jgi:hypothetical protein
MPSLAAYRRLGHHTVDGWLEAPVLTVVQTLSQVQLSKGIGGSVAEIGVHHGRFFIGLVLTDPGCPALAIDVFDHQELNQDGMGRTHRDAFEKNLRRHAGDAAAVTIWARDSTTLEGQDVVDAVGPVRLFSVDGGHSREVVAHDMRTAAQALCDGGVIIADDVFNFGWPGVVEGTLDFMDGQDDVVPCVIAFNKVLFTQPAHASGYQAALEKTARSRGWGTLHQALRGHDVLVMASTPMLRGKNLAKRLLRRG